MNMFGGVDFFIILNAIKVRRSFGVGQELVNWMEYVNIF